MLHAVIDMYKQAEIEAEEQTEDNGNNDEDSNQQEIQQSYHICKNCGNRSESQRGLSVHISKMHNQQACRNLNLINF